MFELSADEEHAILDFGESEELSILRDTVARFAQDELRPRHREFEAARAVAADVRAQYDEMQLARVELPEELGGVGLGMAARVLVLEELGAADPGAAVALDPLGPAYYVLSECGGGDAIKTWALPLLERPGTRAWLHVDERGALSIGNGVVTGTVPWVAAESLDLLAVLTRASAALVDVSAAGIEAVRGSGLRAAGGASLRLDGAPVLAHWNDADAAARALARVRIHVAALMIGVMREAAEYSREYAMGREAFGRPIAHHQGLAFLIADMHSAVEGPRLLVQRAAWLADSGADFADAAATAFAEVAESAMFVTPNALQILGGAGFMQDYPVEKYMREARTLGLLAGGIDWAKEDACRALDANEPPLNLFGGLV